MTNSIFQLLRIRQWIKNLLIFVPLFFGGKILNLDLASTTFFAFVSFCFIASSVYILNDIIDLKYDKEHRIKKNRPIASGAITLGAAVILAGILLAASFSIYAIFIKNTIFLIILASYVFLNVIYSLYLKHAVIYDIVLVSIFYLIRIFAGGVAASVSISGWLFLSIFFFSLFLVIGKRRSELINNSNSRPVLKKYNKNFLDHLIAVTITSGFFTYALYMISIDKPFWSVSIFLTAFIVIRIMYKIFVEEQGEEPEKLFLKDKQIFAALIIWALISFVIVYNL